MYGLMVVNHWRQHDSHYYYYCNYPVAAELRHWLMLWCIVHPSLWNKPPPGCRRVGRDISLVMVGGVCHLLVVLLPVDWQEDISLCLKKNKIMWELIDFINYLRSRIRTINNTVESIVCYKHKKGDVSTVKLRR